MHNDEDVAARVSAVISRSARVRPPYESGAHLYRDLGIESIGALNVLFALEDEFGVALDDQKFIQSVTVKLLVRLIGESRK